MQITRAHVTSEVLREDFYSYLKASTGCRFAALHAGYRPARTLVMIAKLTISAPRIGELETGRFIMFPIIFPRIKPKRTPIMPPINPVKAASIRNRSKKIWRI